MHAHKHTGPTPSAEAGQSHGVCQGVCAGRWGLPPASITYVLEHPQHHLFTSLLHKQALSRPQEAELGTLQACTWRKRPSDAEGAPGCHPLRTSSGREEALMETGASVPIPPFLFLFFSGTRASYMLGKHYHQAAPSTL